jgi:DNA mismatch repair protein MutS2
MVQCGLPVPVGGTSEFGIFDKIFIDIGDQQSIENDLSTYSSHLQNMKYFLANSDNKTLLLIDEFGSGTDPIIGGLIAETILEELNSKNSFGVITTHYSNLKIFASNNAGIANAAMLIDTEKMQPTFSLEVGVPGSSYALEIAQRIGLPQNIIEKTKQKSDKNLLNFDKLLRKTLKDKHYWENKRNQIDQQEKKLDGLMQKNLLEIEKIKKNRDKIISDAKVETDLLLQSVNKKIENTVRIIIESKADKEMVKQSREEIERFKESVDIILNPSNDDLQEKIVELRKNIIRKSQNTEDKVPHKIEIDENKINIGSIVRIIGQTVNGEVIDMNEKTAVISFGSLFTTVELSRIEKVKTTEPQQPKRSNLTHLNYSNKVINFNPHIDVRGYTVDEAIEQLQTLIDEAIMLSIKELHILHGRGNGILRHHIRDYLRRIPQVAKIYSEEEQFGGDGITIVKMR